MIAQFLSSLLPMASLENPQFNLNDPAAYDLLAGVPADSGIHVSSRTAMQLAPVWQAMSIISGDVATSTANVFKRTSEGDRAVATDHDANYLIAVRPNEEMSAFELWRRFMNHATIWQSAYLYVERVGRVGRPLGLYNLLPDRTFSKRDPSGRLFYVTDVDGEPVPLFKEEVIHVKGMSVEVGSGYDLVCAAKNSWGLSLAAEGFESKFFANGAQTGGIVEVPLGTTDEAATRLMSGMQKKHTGKDNWFKVMVLRDGAKFHGTTIDAQKSQMTELREQQVRDTARFFNLPPHKLGLVDSVSYNSSEQSQIQYITGCLTHWFGALRGELQLKLLSEQEQRSESHFIDFNASKLIERDLKTQVEILEIERRNEIINAAEWRRKRNLPPRTDKAAQEYLNPNTKSGPPAKTEPVKPEPTPKTALSPAARAVCEEAISRIARRVTAHARNTAKNSAKLVAWLDSKAHEQRDLFHHMMLPAATLAAEAIGEQGDDTCYAWGGKFFAGLLAMIDVVTKSPYMSSDLEKNVDEQCCLFEAAICADLLGSLNRSQNNAEVSQIAA